MGGTSLALLLIAVGILAALPMLAGCNTKSLGDPTELGLNSDGPVVMPILSQIDPGIEGASEEYPQAGPPIAADLVPATGDYTISANDMLEVTISDLQQVNVDTFRRLQVSETGNIVLPYLGEVHAAGMTESQLTQVIGDAYKQKGYLNNANVTVQVVLARGRAFSIVGAVGAPGEYAITQSDFRMWDALVSARDTVSPLIEYAYIVRKINPNESTAPASGGAATPAPAGPVNVAPTTAPSNEDLAPHSDAGNIANQPMNVLADPPATPSNNPLIDLAESSTQPTTAPATAPAVTQATTENSGGNFEFNSPDAQGYRVIRVPLLKLRNGDPTVNVVIHPHDLIVVQNLPVGNYYMEGHVARPGAYTLTGSKVTVRQAIGAAAGFDALAIPERAEIVRHINPNATLTARLNIAKIFNGEEPDIYLKPDDQILVGTNAIAPFLAALRGSFRITYGFGFLYDRNFSVPDSVAQ